MGTCFRHSLVRVMRAVGGERAPAGPRVNDRASTEALTPHTTLAPGATGILLLASWVVHMVREFVTHYGSNSLYLKTARHPQFSIIATLGVVTWRLVTCELHSVRHSRFSRLHSPGARVAPPKKSAPRQQVFSVAASGLPNSKRPGTEETRSSLPPPREKARSSPDPLRESEYHEKTASRPLEGLDPWFTLVDTLDTRYIRAVWCPFSCPCPASRADSSTGLSMTAGAAMSRTRK